MKLRGPEDFRHVIGHTRCHGFRVGGYACQSMTNYVCLHCGKGRCATHITEHYCATEVEPR